VRIERKIERDYGSGFFFDSHDLTPLDGFDVREASGHVRQKIS
jgi:hypothetical protein